MDLAPDLLHLRDAALGLAAEDLEELLRADARLTAAPPLASELAGVLAYKQRRMQAAMPLLAAAAETDGYRVHRNSELFLMRGYFVLGEAEAALRCAQAVLDREPGNAEALRLAGRVRVREKDWHGAEAAFAELQARCPDDPEAASQRMRVAGQRGDWEAQILHADRWLSLAPNDSESARAEALRMAIDGRVRARRLEGLEDLLPRLWAADAEAAARRLTALRGADQPEIKALTIRNLLAPAAEGGVRDAGDDARATLAGLAEDQAALWLNAAMRLEAAHEDARAAELLRAVRVLRPDDRDAAEYLEQLADGPMRVMRTAIRNHDEAGIARAARRVVAIDPLIIDAWSALGRALLKNDPAEAVEPMRRAAELAAADPFARLSLGRALAGAGRFADAAEAYQEAAELCGPGDSAWRAEAQRGVASSRRKLVGETRDRLREHRPEEAWRALQAARMEPGESSKSLDTAVRRAWFKKVRESFTGADPERARAALAYLQIAPTDRAILLLLGREYMGRRQAEAALPIWRRLAAIEPGQASHHLQAARCLMSMRSPDEAAEEAREARRLNPDLAEAAKLLEPVAQVAAADEGVAG